MRNLVAFIIFLLLLNCSKKDNLSFRLKNETDFELNKITIGFQYETYTFDKISPNSSTSFKPVSELYQTIFIKFFDSKNRKYILQPIDHVGEEIFLKGKATYFIKEIDTVDNYFKLEFSIK